MLILPLHRPLTRATFPFVTALLILANVFVFFVLQTGDADVMQRATTHYVDSGLQRIEAPAYARWLERGQRADELVELQEVPDDMAGYYLAHTTLFDLAFVREMRTGALFDDAATLAAWTPLRADFDAIVAEDFTQRHVLRSSEIDPWRMVSAAFLHGGVGHLIGNMLFLAALGLLVEGALGGWRYLGLYLLGAVGASAASLAWRWGDAGGGLGASGAIAALMGAFCVIWGRRPVRFFYWFFVVFDYVRKPAIWLLPLWLGWEIYNLLANDDMGVGFDAHAGGIVTGALLGAALVALKQTREEFMRDEDELVDDRLPRALQHLGRLQLAEADALLADLQHEQPHRFDVAQARYRVASTDGKPAALSSRALEFLRLPAPDRAAVDIQAMAASHAASLPRDVRDSLLQRWLALGALDPVESLLSADTAVDVQQHDAGYWFALGLRRREAGHGAAAGRALRRVLERHPASAQARKAEFLLAQPD